MTLYRSIIKSSWRITLRHKYLWFFGLFAVLLGNGGEYEIIFRSIQNSGTSESVWLRFLEQTILNLDNLFNFGKRFWENPSLASTILFTYLFILFIFLFIIWMTNVSQIAIVNAIFRDLRKKEHNIKIGMHKGAHYFWKIFSLNILKKILIIATLSLLIAVKSKTIYMVLFMALIPLVVSLLFIIKYAIAYIIIRKEKILESFISAWKLFKKNWIISLELAFLLYLFTISAGLFFMFLSFNIVRFFQILSNQVWVNFPTLSFYLFYTVMPIILFGALAFIGSLLSVFQISSWTKLFLELDNKGSKSKIERIFSK